MAIVLKSLSGSRSRERCPLVLVAMLVACGAASAAPLDLSRVPPEINASVPPNILVTLDDSGSMGWGFMPDGANYGIDNWRRYDSSYNRIYYNPSVTYTPPLRQNGTSFPNSTFTEAWWDGYHPTLGNSNLGTSYRVSGDHQGACENYSCGWFTSGFPAGVASGGNQRAFYSTSGTIHIIGAAQRQNFANWFSYYRTRSLAARTAMSSAFVGMDPGTRVAWQNFNINHLSTSTNTRPIAEGSAWRTQFFNWLQTRRQSGNTPMWPAFHRAGNYFENSTATNTTNPYYDDGYGDELSCRQSFHVLMTDGYGNVVTSGTGIPNYDNLNRAIHDGRTLSGPASRVYHSVAAGGTAAPNLSDMAMYYWARDLRPTLDNNVPAYFGNRATGLIPGAAAEDEIYFNPDNDPATWQRLVNFTITFGAGGTLAYSPATLQAIRTGPTNWPAVTSGSASTIDDAWHAAVNSRGAFLSAEDPQELINSLAAILDNVSRRQGVTGSAGSTSFLRSDTVQYQASYDSGTWRGDIIAERIDPVTGEPTGALAWPNSAGAQLDARSPGSRRIFVNTRAPTAANPSAAAELFNWGGDLGPVQALLNIDPLTGSSDGLGAQRVAWIRGDRSREQANGGPFRDRSGVLGPFIGSSLINVAAPRFGYRGSDSFDEGGSRYAAFRAARLSRRPTIYIGGNDGMLHAFDASSGEEVWAYIPNRVAHNLPRLSTPAYQFVPFVNATPIDHDVYIDNAWKTVLVGTLGLGGQGVYAIDVTDPNTPIFMWEVTDAVDSHLGYTYGRANVGRLSDGTWVAFVAAGYNSETTVDYATRGMPNAGIDSHTASGESVGAVIAIRLEDGQSQRIDIPAGRGLATVQLADYELDYAVDFAVAGDLNGDMWRIDLAGLSWDSLASAHVDHLFRGNRVSGVPQHPITTAPSIFNDPSIGKLVVVVGTGKYIEDSDREIVIPRQRIYGIRECGAGCAAYPIQQSTLVEQVMTDTHNGGDGYAYLNMTQTRVVPPTSNGWYLQLGNASFLSGRLRGERVIDMSVPISFSAGIVALGSFIPSDDPCSPLGEGAIYALSASTGGFAIPGDLNGAGTAYEPGDAIFPGGTNRSVGRVMGERIDLSAFLNPDGGTMSIMGASINGVPIRRRSGWRDIPLE